MTLKDLTVLRDKSCSLTSSIYVERKLLDQAVTGASYVDLDDKEHHFRRSKLNPKEKPSLEKALSL